MMTSANPIGPDLAVVGGGLGLTGMHVATSGAVAAAMDEAGASTGRGGPQRGQRSGGDAHSLTRKQKKFSQSLVHRRGWKRGGDSGTARST